MGGDRKPEAFKKRLLLLPSLLVAAISLPMASGLIRPNPVYGFRTAASLASMAVWYRANFWAGTFGVVLGVAGALLVRIMLKRSPVDAKRALLAAAVGVFAVIASAAAGWMAS